MNFDLLVLRRGSVKRQNVYVPVLTLVSQPRLSRARRESGQIPIIISFLTRQEFLGVLIDLVTNGGRAVAFFGMLCKSEA